MQPLLRCPASAAVSILLRTLFSVTLLNACASWPTRPPAIAASASLLGPATVTLFTLHLPLQTGAGKTFSLSSIAADAIGMIPRAAAEIFSHIEGDPTHEYTVYMSYVQLYMELIQVGMRRKAGECRVGWWGIAGQRGAQHSARLCLASIRGEGRPRRAVLGASSLMLGFNPCQESAVPTV